MSIRQTVLAILLGFATAAAARAQCAPSWVTTPAGFGADGEVYCALEWDPDGPGPAPVELVVGGAFQEVCGTPARNLARISLQSLTASPFGSGANGAVQSLALGFAGELFVGGAFTQIDGNPATGVASFGGGAWSSYGSGVDITGGGPRALLPELGGSLVVGGHLVSAGGVPVASVARWDGVAWTAMGAGLRPVDGLQPLVQETGGVRALMTSPNGIIAAGMFDASGTQPVFGVAEWNGSTWTPVGNAFNSILELPTAAVRDASGALFACGFVLGNSSAFVRRWDGTTWTSLPAPACSARVMTVTPTGEVVVGGPVTISHVSVESWDGTSWNLRGTAPLQFTLLRLLSVAAVPSRGPDAIFVSGRLLTQMSGVPARSFVLHSAATGWIGETTTFVSSSPTLHIGPRGDTLVTGATAFGVTSLPGVGQWNGSTWGPVPQSPASVTALAFDHEGGMIVASGSLVFRWDGASWTSFGSVPVGDVNRLAVMSNGTIVAVNSFGTGSSSGRYWQGGWQVLGASPVNMASHPDGRLIAVGTLGGIPIGGRVAAWDGATWSGLDPTFQIDASPSAVVAMPNGDIVVGGPFLFANHIARFDGTAWQPMGAGFNAEVSQLVVLADGRLVARGPFTLSGTVPCPGLAIWDGLAWQPLPGAPTGAVSLAAHPNGDLWAVAGRRIVRLETPCPAAATSQPTGCVNAGAAGQLEAARWPMVGSSFQTLVTGLPSPALAAVVFGVPTPPLVLSPFYPLAAAGCDLRVAADLLFYRPTTTGFARFEIDVPNTPNLVGLNVTAQAAGIATSGANIVGLTTTNSLALTIGSRQ